MTTHLRGSASILATLVAIGACQSTTSDDGRGTGDASTDAGSGGMPTNPNTGGQSAGGKSTASSGGATTANGGATSSGGATSNGGATSSGGATTANGGAPSNGGSGENPRDAGSDSATDHDADAGSTDAAPDTSADAGPVTDAAPDGGSRTPAREFAYVSARFNGGGVSTASIDLSSGKLDVLPNARVASRGAVAVAVGSTQRFIYVADEVRHIETYRIAADGRPSAQPTSSIEAPDAISTLALDPKERFAYAGAVVDINDTAQGRAVHTYKIASDTGALSAGEDLLVGTANDFTFPAFVAIDPTGTFAYVSLSGETGLRGYRIDQTTGKLAELPDSPFTAAVVPNAAGVFAGGIVFKASGDFLYTAGGGLNAFAIDRTSGKLTRVAGSPFSTEIQSDPSAPNITIDARGKYLYVTKFDAFNGPPSLSGFEIDQSTGALTPVPNSPIRNAGSPYSIALDPSGTFALVGQDFGQVSVYALNPSTGAFVREVEGSPFDLGGLEPKIAFAALPE